MILVAFVVVTAVRYRLRSRGFGVRVANSRTARSMFLPRDFGMRGGEGVDPFNQSGGTVNQTDRTL